MSNIHINSQFDGGNIQVVDISNPKKIVLRIRPDSNSTFLQWFYFQVNNVQHQDITINITDLKSSSYIHGWSDYKVCYSYDNQYWQRLQTTFDGNTLKFKLTPTANSIYFAYFEPYPYTRHLELIGLANQFPNVFHESLGVTHQGRNIDLLTIGRKNAPNKIWLIGRQHPGEIMAEWFIEGFIHRLLDNQDSISRTLLLDSVFYIVPNMNPDGAFNGNLRTNYTGTNLNREWLKPSIKNSPEVYYVRQKMQQTGVDMFFDIHGDENLAYVFTVTCDENKSYSKKQATIYKKFTQYLAIVNPDYQTVVGYPRAQFDAIQYSKIATHWVGDQFNCLAVTLEMPFKDNTNGPDAEHGWNGNRSYNLGQDFLTAINLVRH